MLKKVKEVCEILETAFTGSLVQGKTIKVHSKEINDKGIECLAEIRTKYKAKITLKRSGTGITVLIKL